MIADIIIIFLLRIDNISMNLLFVGRAKLKLKVEMTIYIKINFKYQHN
jgi:hypothetical protein